jgi:hypothetical protein
MQMRSFSFGPIVILQEDALTIDVTMKINKIYFFFSLGIPKQNRYLFSEKYSLNVFHQK